jgi:uncharacterized protein YndB with AHSA1/START domain
MSKEMIVKNEIQIGAPATAVWDALTNPVQTQKYMHGCALDSDWQEGSPLLWKAVYEGKEMVFVKGNIVRIKPNTFLAYTTMDAMNPELQDIPENYLTVTYDLSEADGKTNLIVTQGDYTNVPNGEKKYNDAIAAGGWSSILDEIKKIAEGN